MTHRNTQHVVLNDTRWLAKVTYKSDNGLISINYPFDNVEELTDLVEAAQERGRIVEIEILLSGRSGQASGSWPWGAGKTWGVMPRD
jgi:hypothetical protein